jgi:hypothetical protein
MLVVIYFQKIRITDSLTRSKFFNDIYLLAISLLLESPPDGKTKGRQDYP